MSKINNIILLAIMLVSSVAFAQTGGIKGKITSESGEALLGINTLIQGTSLGAATNLEGEYEIKDISAGDHNVIVTGIGFIKQVIQVNIVENRTLEIDVVLVSTDIKLSEVIVAANIAKDRETPVAFTDISEEEIKKGFTVQDIPHLFANTPGVYITSDGGSGMGDSKVTIRGFDEQRISVMINNVPVNDPESKKVYWSNWGSLPAASQSIQIQRGVGSSLYGSGALGGSINVITKDAPAASSLDLAATLGQYGIMKYGVDYNSGLLNDKFAFIGRFNYMTGNGWRNNTFYEGMNYYLSGMYFPDEKNTFKIILHGAPQYHAYSYYGFPAEDFAQYGRDWNGHPYVAESAIDGTNYADRSTSLMDVLFMGIDPGTKFSDQKGGVVVGNGNASLDNNVYHKPQFEVHHTYKFNDITKLTSTFFVSKGYGYGENVNNYYRVDRDNNGLMTWDNIYNASSSVYQYRAYSDHFQTGLLSSLQTKLMDTHDLTFGVEARYWDARHAGEILNTFSNDDITYYIGNNGQDFTNGDLYYDYNTTKPQLTTFAHALWRFGNFSVMTDLQFSYLDYNVVEDMPSSNNYPLDVDPTNKGNGTWTGTATDDEGNLVEYSLWDYEKSYTYLSPKVGLNYNVNENLNVFANWSRAVNEPRVKYFFGYGSPNDDLDLETTSDIELGLGYRGEIGSVFFDAKYNFYNIDFDGKALRIQDPTKSNTPGYDYKGRRYIPIGESTYRGHELALSIDLPYGFALGFNGSIAENHWGEPGDSEGSQYLYSKDDVVAGVDFTDTDADGSWDTGEAALHSDFVDKFDKKVEVGMPQTIIGATLGYTYEGFFANAALRFYKDLYVLENNADVIVEGHFDAAGEWIADEESPTLPSATVIDMILGYSTDFAGFPLRASVHVNNLLDEEYWQKGDSYGFLPGAERTVIFNLQATIF
jgi:outer membrane receptor protein involved in Fe transport